MFVVYLCSDSLAVTRNVLRNMLALKCSQNLQEITETLIGIHGRSLMKELVYNKVAGFQPSLSTLVKNFPYIYI